MSRQEFSRLSFGRLTVLLALAFTTFQVPIIVRAETNENENEDATPIDDSSIGNIQYPTTATPLAPLTSELSSLRTRLRSTLALYHGKHLAAQENSCWEVMHGIIAYGVDAKLYRSTKGSPTVNAIGWMAYNQPCQGEMLFYLDRGKLVARRGPGLQGHFGQFLAIVAQSHVASDFPMKVSGKNFTLADLIEHEKRDCRDGEELTFKLIGLAHYLDSDETWTTPDGQKWGIPRLIREELKQPIRGAACGGTHRLMGHSYAVYKRRKQNKPIDGEFARAEKFISDYQAYTFSLQNSDGSFSTNWFKGREATPDIDRRVKTTGHILEWMTFSLPEAQLRDPRTLKAVNYLVNVLASDPNHKWEIGPQGHALHALRIYDRRMFKPYDQQGQAPTAPPVAVKKLPASDVVPPTSRVAETPKIVKETPVRLPSQDRPQSPSPEQKSTPKAAAETPKQPAPSAAKFETSRRIKVASRTETTPPVDTHVKAPDVPPIELAQ